MDKLKKALDEALYALNRARTAWDDAAADSTEEDPCTNRWKNCKHGTDKEHGWDCVPRENLDIARNMIWDNIIMIDPSRRFDGDKD